MGVDDTEKARQAAKEIRRLTEGPLQDAIKAEKDRADRTLGEARARSAVIEAQIQDRLTHRPKNLGSVNDITFDSSGRIVGPNMRILQWDDGYGNSVYTANTVGHIFPVNQIHPLSDRIQAQQTSFGGLEVQEQLRLRREFDSSNGTAAGIQPYKAYLDNAALGKRFEELKAHPPRPFGG